MRQLIECGLDASVSYLFVIDGSTALRSSIDEMFGQRAQVQHCRTHKLRNVPHASCAVAAATLAFDAERRVPRAAAIYCSPRRSFAL